jgi:MerR family transcriptional regulator, copper efflux regulator
MKQSDPLLTRGGLAHATGVHIETIRFYEKKGILGQPARTAAGYRLYPMKTVQQIRFIKRAQDLGFTLTEIAELLKLRSLPETSSLEVRDMAQEKIALIDEKIRDLRSMRNTLQGLTKRCDGESSVTSCPIMAAMEGSQS